MIRSVGFSDAHTALQSYLRLQQARQTPDGPLLQGVRGLVADALLSSHGKLVGELRRFLV